MFKTKRKTITARFFQFTLVFALIFISLSLSFYMIIRYRFEQSLYDNTLILAGMLESIVISELHSLEKESIELATDDMIQNTLKTWYSGEKTDVLNALDEFLSKLKPSSNIDDYVTSIRIVDLDGAEFISSTSFDNPLSQDSSIKIRDVSESTRGEAVFLTLQDGRNSRMDFYCLRSIREKRPLSLEHLGTLLIRYDLEKLLNKYKIHFSDFDTSIFVYDDERQIYPYPPDEHDIGHEGWQETPRGYSIIDINNDQFFITSRKDKLIWDYSFLIPLNELSGDIRRIYKTIIITHSLVIMILLISAWFFTGRITRPMVELSRLMNSEVEDDFKTTLAYQKVTPKMSREVASLYCNYSIAIDKINNLLKQDYLSKIELQKSQYRILKTQINPHFLYNTLDSIGWLAQKKGIGDVAVMVRALGKLLRSTLKEDKNLIPARDEVSLAKEYLRIQKIRFGERLDYHINIDAKDEKWLIPTFTIQPIIENSIKYGIEAGKGVGVIKISIMSEGDFLLLRIEDDGPGFDKGLLDKLNAGRFPESNSSGIGLKNIYLRGKAILGERVNLEIYNIDPSGAGIVIYYPLNKEPLNV